MRFSISGIQSATCTFPSRRLWPALWTGVFFCGLGSAHFLNDFGRAYKLNLHLAQNLLVLPFRLRATLTLGIAVMSVPAHAWDVRSPATNMAAPVFRMPAPQAPFRHKSEEIDRPAPGLIDQDVRL